MSISDLLKSRFYTKIGDLVLDATIRELHDLKKDVTAYPVEQGAEINDHVRPVPREITIEGVVTDTPVIAIVDRIRSIGSTRKNYVQSAFEYLEKLYINSELIDISTKYKVYRGMALLSAPVNRTRQEGRALIISATFRQVNQVSFSSTVLGSQKRVAKDNQKAKQVNNRETATTTKDKTAQRVSILRGLLR